MSEQKFPPVETIKAEDKTTVLLTYFGGATVEAFKAALSQMITAQWAEGLIISARVEPLVDQHCGEQRFHDRHATECDGLPQVPQP